MSIEKKFQEGGDPTPEAVNARPEAGPEEKYLELQEKLEEKFNNELASLNVDQNKYPAKYNEFWTKLFQFPVVGVSQDGAPAILEAGDIRVPPLDASRQMAGAAYAYDEYAQANLGIAGAPGIPDSLKQKFPSQIFDHAGLGGGKISFGAGEEKGKRFLMFRKLQNPNYRGGYPYIGVIDPGEALRKKVGYNDAILIRNILADPVWRHFLLERPDNGSAAIGNVLLARLEQSYLKTEPAASAGMRSMTEGLANGSGPDLVAEPTPEQMAQLMAGMSEEERKQYTFLVNGTKGMGSAGGMKNVWDPVWGPGGAARK